MIRTTSLAAGVSEILLFLTLAAPLSAQAPAPGPVIADPNPPPAGGDSPPPPAPPVVPANGGEIVPSPPLLDRGGMANFLNPAVGSFIPRADYRAAWFPQEQVQNQPAKLGYLQQDFSLNAPFWQCPGEEWSATVHIRAESFHTGAILPDTQQPFPDELWNVHFGTSYRHLFDNGWVAGGTVTLGSASDKPFHSINEMTVGATAFLRVPQGEHNAWLFSLNFSTNSEVLNYIPIPGVAYLYAPSDAFQAMIGFPFASVFYRPDDDWILQFSYALLTNIHTRATYLALRPLRLYAGFDWSNESYFLVNRPEDRDRFFYFDQSVTLGLQLPVRSFNAVFDLSGGYSFDRYYFEGRTINHQNFNRINVGDAPFVALRAAIRF
jgi:hypothetical protein